MAGRKQGGLGLHWVLLNGGFGDFTKKLNVSGANARFSTNTDEQEPCQLLQPNPYFSLFTDSGLNWWGVAAILAAVSNPRRVGGSIKQRLRHWVGVD